MNIDSIDLVAESWLSLQCKIIGEVVQAVLLVAKPGSETLVPAAIWPVGVSGEIGLSGMAELAVSGRRYVIQEEKSNPTSGTRHTQQTIAYPLVMHGRVPGVVVVKLRARSEAEQRTLLQQLEWGTAWLEALMLQQDAATKDRLSTVLDVLAGSIEQKRFGAAAMVAVTDLAARLDCERVSLGLCVGKHVRVKAMSNSAEFGRKTNLIRDIEAAMEEAADQQKSLVYPASKADELPAVTRCQGELSHRHRSGAVCTVPMSAGSRSVGALTLERANDRPFDSETTELCEHLGSLLGPLLDLKQKEDRWLGAKVWRAFTSALSKIAGPKHPALKIYTLTIIGILLYLSLATGVYRVSATALIEPEMQRAVVAPIEGYIQSAPARAGDIVAAESLLAKLEDKDLKLEYLKWINQQAKLRKEYRQAFAEHDRAQVTILKAQIDQANAQVELLGEQLARVRLLAPFDGIIVSGDLTQNLGSPVERGEVLFEVAPLDAYRVVLQVDEAEIADIIVGQRGKLALSGLPTEKLAFVVENLTPVATAEDGKNFFRVEAHLEEQISALRPGMEGVGKIEIDRRKRLWIWTHKLIDWWRIWAWRWWPA